jgi:hypothetical protein
MLMISTLFSPSSELDIRLLAQPENAAGRAKHGGGERKTRAETNLIDRINNMLNLCQGWRQGYVKVSDTSGSVSETAPAAGD